MKLSDLLETPQDTDYDSIEDKREHMQQKIAAAKQQIDHIMQSLEVAEKAGKIHTPYSMPKDGNKYYERSFNPYCGTDRGEEIMARRSYAIADTPENAQTIQWFLKAADRLKHFRAVLKKADMDQHSVSFMPLNKKLHL